MTLKTSLYFSKPYQFGNVCTIYPIVLNEYLEHSSDYWNSLIIPFCLSHDYLGKDFEKFSMWQVVMMSSDWLAAVYVMIKILCRAEDEDIEIKADGIHINKSEYPLNADNFDEFANIVRTMFVVESLKGAEPEIICENQANQERLLKLKKNRERQAQRDRENAFGVLEMINTTQHNGNSYISDEEILKWTYWRLTKSFDTIMEKNSWDNKYDVYLVCGDADIIKPHWIENFRL